MAQGFGLDNIRKIAHRTAQRGDFINSANNISLVLSGKSVPTQAKDRAAEDISKDEGR